MLAMFYVFIRGNGYIYIYIWKISTNAIIKPSSRFVYFVLYMEYLKNFLKKIIVKHNIENQEFTTGKKLETARKKILLCSLVRMRTLHLRNGVPVRMIYNKTDGGHLNPLLLQES